VIFQSIAFNVAPGDLMLSSEQRRFKITLNGIRAWRRTCDLQSIKAVAQQQEFL